MHKQQVNQFSYIATERPALMGELRGSAAHPDISGLVYAYWLDGALYIQAELTGLPPDSIFGFHIHEGLICGEADAAEPFVAAKGHLSLCPEGMWCARHPYHAGDLPPIFSDSTGYAAMEVYLGKVNVSDYSGKPIVLHSMPDDFKLQPAGNSGKRIACGLFAEYL